MNGDRWTRTPARPAARSAPVVRTCSTAVPCEQPWVNPRKREREHGEGLMPGTFLPPLTGEGAAGGWGRAQRAWLAATLLLSILASTAHAQPPARDATSSSASAASATPSRAGADSRTAANEARVRAAFDAWRAGTGNVFDLLHEDAVWTVAGDSPVSGTYRGRRDFMDNAVAPITARLATPIVPELDHLVAQGDAMVAIWRGTARAKDGDTYANHYAWHMVFDDDGRIVRVVAFLDTWALQALME